MSCYTKHRIYNLSSGKFSTLNERLMHAIGCTFNALDIGWGVPQPGKPIAGGIFERLMNSAYRPRFYWNGDRLIVYIPDVIDLRGNPAYSQEQGFWGLMDKVVKECGGSAQGGGQGVPSEVPEKYR